MSMIDQVQKAYIAYYGRPADPEGLAFWVGQLEDAGGDLTQILNAFGTSDEFNERFGDDDDETLINNIYANLFGREADKEGLEFYLGLLEDGEPLAFIAQRILDGAQNEDADDVDAKLAAAKLFTAEVEASGAPYEGDDAADEAAVWLARINSGTVIDADAGTIDGKTIADIVEEVVPTPSPGETFTLTAGTDDITGTDGDDVFNAPLSQVQDGQGLTEFQTLNNTDVLDGGDGFDRLNATLIDGSDAGTGSETTPELIENIEQFFIRSRAQDNELVMTNVTGVEQVWNDKSTQNLIISDLQEEVILGVIGGNGKNYTVTYNANATDADFMQAVVLQGADIATLSVTDAGVNLTGLSLDVTGGDVELVLAGHLPGIEDLMISGDSSVTLTPDLDDLVTIESTTTGDVNLVAGDDLETASFGDGDDTLSTGGNSVESISMGGGDDVLTITSTLDDEAEIDMGDGDDRLVLDDNINITFAGMLDGGSGTNTIALAAMTADAVSNTPDFDEKIQNFQILEVGSVAEDEVFSVDVSNLNGINHVVTSAIAPATTPASAAVHTFEVISGADADGGSFFLNGVEITVDPNDTPAAVATAIANADFSSVPEIDQVQAGGAFVSVIYTVAAGPVPNDFLQFAENPDSSGVEFGSNTVDTAGVKPVQEVQSFTVTAGSSAAGGDIVLTPGGGAAVTITVAGNLTQADVAAAIAAEEAAIIADNSDVVSVEADGNKVTITYAASADDVALATVTSANNDGGEFSAVSEDVAGDEGTDGVQTFTLDAVDGGTNATGGNFIIDGVSIPLGPNLSVNQVGVELVDFFNANSGDFPNVILLEYDVATQEVTLTLDRENAPYDTDPSSADTTIQIQDDPATSTVVLGGLVGDGAVPLDPNLSSPFVPSSQEGSLTLDNMQSGDTVELSDAVDGALVINVEDADENSDDVVKLLLNGVGELLNLGAVIVDDVETINITTTNSDEDNLPTGPSALNLQAPDAETVTVTGNHGVDFFGSDLSSMTLLDASGVNASESAPGLENAGTVGAVFISTGATDADVTILTGNGNDFINVAFVGTDPDDEGSSATIVSTGGDNFVIASAGDDTITLGDGDDLVNLGLGGNNTVDFSAGGDNVVLSGADADTIIFGDGNDTYALVAAGHSVVQARDVLIDFSPNTVGQGAGGAVTDQGAAAAADRDGDVISLLNFGIASLNVEVFDNATDVDTFLANSGAAGSIGLDSSNGRLYLDLDGDGNANSVIELAGVTTIDEAAFVI